MRAAPLWAPSQALTPLTIGRNRFAASALGALWGFGHSTGQLILGLFFVLLKVRGAAAGAVPRREQLAAYAAAGAAAPCACCMAMQLLRPPRLPACMHALSSVM